MIQTTNMKEEKISAKQISRFNAKWTPEPFSGCWLWSGAVGGPAKWQHGEFWCNGRLQKAHRVSWQIHRGVIPDSLFALHKCDTPPCVNPGHLFLGTQGDNIRDASLKGRLNTPSGEAHYKSKLTKLAVEQIRASQLSMSELAERYGVCKATIRAAMNRVTWK